ncbi:MAG TPA: hypothetical protein VMV93_11915 [Chloroflexota bacterium]|nr:hypothetical protein [Chloroflexota bacterium]
MPDSAQNRPKTLAELEAVLRDLGCNAQEASSIAPTIGRLNEWTAPVPSALATSQLIERLLPLVAINSPIREALRARQRGMWQDFLLLLRLVRSQVSIVRWPFWFGSMGLILLGVLLVWARPAPDKALMLYLCGPLVGYLGVASAFRGIGLGTLESELACPSSERQITLARLVVILTYLLALGAGGGLLLAASGSASPLSLTLDWLSPLLLVSGLTLLLSLRFSVEHAGAAVYAAWLATIVAVLEYGGQGPAPFVVAQLPVTLAGLACLTFAVSIMPGAMPRLLARG